MAAPCSTQLLLAASSADCLTLMFSKALSVSQVVMFFAGLPEGLSPCLPAGSAEGLLQQRDAVAAGPAPEGQVRLPGEVPAKL